MNHVGKLTVMILLLTLLILTILIEYAIPEFVPEEQPTHVILLEMKVNPDSMKRLKTYLSKILTESRKFDGLIRLRVSHSENEPNNILLYQEWKDKQSFRNYIQWRNENEVLEKIMQKLDTPWIRKQYVFESDIQN